MNPLRVVFFTLSLLSLTQLFIQSKKECHAFDNKLKLTPYVGKFSDV